MQIKFVSQRFRFNWWVSSRINSNLFNGPFSNTMQVSRYQKKNIRSLTASLWACCIISLIDFVHSLCTKPTENKTKSERTIHSTRHRLCWTVNWLTELRFYVPLDTRSCRRRSSQPISWHSTEKTKSNTTEAHTHTNKMITVNTPKS